MTAITLLAAAAALWCGGWLPNRASVETRAAAERIRRIATTPTIAVVDESTELPQIIVSMPGASPRERLRYIGRAYLDRHTHRIEATFEDEAPSGEIWGPTRPMDVDDYARAVETRARGMQRGKPTR